MPTNQRAVPGADFPSGRRPRLWALVPVKSLRHAKSRLGPALGAAERAALVGFMLRDVLDALTGCARLEGVLVVTPDPHVARLAECHGAEVLAEDPPASGRGGVNEAVRQGRRALEERGADAVAVIPGDVPLLTAGVVERLLDALGEPPSVVLAPDTEGVGTNALLCAPPGLVDPAFGTGSFAEHRARARAAGVEATVVAIPELALDLDQPDDLRRVVDPDREGACRTIRFLGDAGIARRVAAIRRQARAVAGEPDRDPR